MGATPTQRRNYQTGGQYAEDREIISRQMACVTKRLLEKLACEKSLTPHQ